MSFDGSPCLHVGVDKLNFADMNGDSGSNVQSMSKSLNSACDILKKLSDQLHYKDFPPSNEPSASSLYALDETGRIKDITTGHNNKSDGNLRKQSQRQQPVVESWDDTDNSSTTSRLGLSPSNAHTTCSSVHSSTSVSHCVQLGNRPLGQLCLWSLHALSSTLMDLESCNDQIEHTSTNDSEESALVSPVNPYSSCMSPRRNIHETSSLHDSVASIDPSYAGGSNRLCMFASEYARHFSKSALSPPMRARTRHSRRKKLKAGLQSKLFDVSSDDSMSSGAILDIVATTSTETPPNYQNITPTNGTYKVGMPIRLLVKKERSWEKAAQRPCVAAIAVVFPDRKEFVPPGFVIVRDVTTGQAANLGTSNNRIMLCYRRSREGNPLTNIILLAPTLQESVPNGYTVVEKSPRNYIAKLEGLSKDGHPIFVGYKQRLESLESMRPLALIVSSCNDIAKNSLTNRGPITNKVGGKHHYYYCTGGTVDKAFIGRYHVLDRSTHLLLSPSSVINRLSLIGMSRRQSSIKEFQSTDTAMNQSSNNHGVDSKSQSEFELKQIQKFTVPFERTVADKKLERCLSSFYRHYNDNCLETHSLIQCMDELSFIPLVATPLGDKPNSFLHQSLRIVALMPILTACYTRHGGSALVAVEGLCTLIKDTDFFASDFVSTTTNPAFCQRRDITLLDLAIQAVCDVATNGSHETTFVDCVEFVETAVTRSEGCLHPRTFGFIARFYLFIFYFGASFHVLDGSDQIKEWHGTESNSTQPTKFLTDPRESGTSRVAYLPGGAPQGAALAFKDMISVAIHRLGRSTIFDLCGNPSKEGISSNYTSTVDQNINVCVELLLDSAVSNAVGSVERANYIQLALHQIHRSGGSELFWHEMIHVCGSGVFQTCPFSSEGGKELYAVVFSLFAIIIKAATGKSNFNHDDELLPRDRENKLLAMELLLHFLECWSDEQEAIDGMPTESNVGRFSAPKSLSYSIRRMVASCLLFNSSASFKDIDVYKRTLDILSELWCSPIYRRYCKIEIGLLVEHFILDVINKKPHQFKANKETQDKGDSILLKYQIELLSRLKGWFTSDPQNTIELLLNFELSSIDGSLRDDHEVPGLPHDMFQKLMSSLSMLIERCSDTLGRQIVTAQAKLVQTKPNRSHAKTVLCRNESEKVDLLSEPTRAAMRDVRKSALHCMLQMVKALAVCSSSYSDTCYHNLICSWSSGTDDTLFVNSLLSRDCDKSKINNDSKSHTEACIEHTGDEGLSIETKLNTRDLLATAVGISKEKSLKKAIEFLIACNYLQAPPRNVSAFLRLKCSLFESDKIGEYLGESGIDGSDLEYWKAIRYSFIRSTSFVGMDVVRALRFFLTDCGFQLPGEAQKVDRILSTFAQCYYEDNAGDAVVCPFENEDSIFFLSFAVIMLNTDLHKNVHLAKRSKHKRMTKSEFVNNIKNAGDQGSRFDKDHLCAIYESILDNPIKMSKSTLFVDSSDTDSLQDPFENVRMADSIMRGLAVHDFRFVRADTINDSSRVRSHVRDCVTRIWHYWHGVVNSGLEVAHLDPSGLEPLVSVLLFSLCATVCLKLENETIAFLEQLKRLRLFEEQREGIRAHMNVKDSWQKSIESLLRSDDEKARVCALCSIRDCTQSIQSALLLDSINREDMAELLKTFEDADYLLQDPSRQLIRNGHLVKKSSRTGQSTLYHFFLFSDLLLYGRTNNQGVFVIHEELPLHLLKVIDSLPSNTKNRQLLFKIVHPRKIFTVKCATEAERHAWLEGIKQALLLEVDHKVKTEAARQAVRQNVCSK